MVVVIFADVIDDPIEQLSAVSYSSAPSLADMVTTMINYFTKFLFTS